MDEVFASISISFFVPVLLAALPLIFSALFNQASDWRSREMKNIEIYSKLSSNLPPNTEQEKKLLENMRTSIYLAIEKETSKEQNIRKKAETIVFMGSGFLFSLTAIITSIWRDYLESSKITLLVWISLLFVVYIVSSFRLMVIKKK